MRFQNPHLLWLLLVIPPALALFFWWRERGRRKLLVQFVQARLLPVLTAGVSPLRRKIRFSLLVLAAALLIVALARPQHGFDLQPVQQRGLDIIVAIDVSKSMLARDIAPDRLERAKLAALELMQDAQSDRLGLVAFAGDAFLECPMTIDNTAFQESVQALDVNSLPLGGTDIAAAIQTAQTAFARAAGHQALVLLTDGEDTVNPAAALQAAQAAAKTGLKIFTVGIGTKTGDLLRVEDANGNSDYVRDAQGNVVKSHLDASLLRQIAQTTGAFYLPLRGAAAMDTLYSRGLALLPKTVGQGLVIRRWHEQYQWPLAAAIALLLAEIFLPERRKTSPPQAAPAANARPAPQTAPQTPPLPRPGVALGVIPLALLLLLPLSALASPSAALHDYRSANYTNALAEFSRLADLDTNDLRLAFDAGDAAYRATNFDQAAAFFQQAALSPDLRLQQKAMFNLGNARFQLAKSAPDLDGLLAGLETAQKSYQHAVLLDTNDTDAAFNLAFVKNAVEQIKRLRAILLRAKSQADAAVRRAEFHKALEIMLPLEKTVAAKQFHDYTKRLQNIDAIATPHHP
ncbi:MAG: VWA domain-containing protein [Verrucomicrobia bacterium]|nr:VWA domain-containing protein [Verrucomicrobiota bacterium]MDE3098496.1 VWA domain-containing protein [Verrucomicrobiota bacterium]